MGWQVPLVATNLSGICAALEAVSPPNQGGYAAEETGAQFSAARDAALAILASQALGADGIFTVRLSGNAQEEHGASFDIPLEQVTIEIAKHAPIPQEIFSAGPVTITLSSGPTDPAESQPIEAVRIEIARHQPRIGRRSYQ